MYEIISIPKNKIVFGICLCRHFVEFVLKLYPKKTAADYYMHKFMDRNLCIIHKIYLIDINDIANWRMMCYNDNM